MAEQMTPKEYDRISRRRAPGSRLLTNTLGAFLVGGAICALGELLTNIYLAAGLGRQEAGAVTSVTLVFLSALLTGLKVYDRLAKFGKAGTLVPITGFANAVVSPALEFKAEGFVMGLGAKLFSIAGPVILYGVTASALYGAVLFLLGRGGA